MSMSAAPVPTLAVDLSRWPGTVLHVVDAQVAASNGRLEALLGERVVGRRIDELVDQGPSLSKWRRLVSDRRAGDATWELVFCAAARLLDPMAFSVVRENDDALWLVEHPEPPRLAELAHEAAEVNTELTHAQRSLVIERSLLARALQELERSNSALDEFAHVVSHDLKAPLRAIREYVDLLVTRSEHDSDEDRAGYARRLTALTDRMRAMIDAALAYARAGRSADRVESVDTGALLREIVEFLAPPPDVAIEIAPGLPTLETERNPFEQVFRNLLSNAIAYRREGGARVEVSARPAGDQWEFVVADDGPGIPESQRDRVWRLFHTSRPGEGTGLGLALVRRLVLSYGGSVEIGDSVAGGAAFHVRWPRRPVSGSAAKMER